MCGTRLCGALRRSALLAALALSGAAWGQSDDLPKAESILDRYVEVTGGKAAYEKRKNSVMTMTLSIPANGMKGTLKLYHAAPNLQYATTDIEGLGKSEEGFDGKVSWENSAMMGARIREGDELKMRERAAVFNPELQWRKLYKKSETVAAEEIGGKAAHKVKLTTPEDREEFQWFDKESGYLVKVQAKVPTAMGEIPIESTFADYKDAGGVKIPHTTTQSVMGTNITLTIEKCEINVDLPKDRFDLPKEVKEILDKPKAPASKPADSGAKPE